jgi:hypothetical protein
VVRLPRSFDGTRRPTGAEACFWLVVATLALAFLFWIQHRDQMHDQWDWSDWLEGTFASVCGGFVVTGVVWVAVSALVARLPRHSPPAGRRRA